MEWSPILRIGVNVLFVILGSLLLFLVCFLTFGPSVYNAYNPDYIEEVDTDGRPIEQSPRSENAEHEAYGRFVSGAMPILRLKAQSSVQVVVLGDIGRSPRMQYHALSLANHGARVDVIGYVQSEPLPAVTKSTRITIHALAATPESLSSTNPLMFLLLAPLKLLFQSLVLYRAMAHRTKPSKYILLQNPPGIPTLFIAALVASIRGSRLVIDWHNLTWSMIGLRFKAGTEHPAVKVAQTYEYSLAAAAHKHITVTSAMAQVLARDAGVKASVLHDRPASQFVACPSSDMRDAVLRRLEVTREHAVELKAGKWRLLVSSTSWTADEDFSLLLDALVSYSASATAATRPSSFPCILAVITGKGAQRAEYEARIRTLNQASQLSHVVIRTAFLSAADYAALLSTADLGVSLHSSSSGLDLPMKVLDMFGAGIPVAALTSPEFAPTLAELVNDGVNGVSFETAQELADTLSRLFAGGADGAKLLATLRAGALAEGSRRWEDEWDRVAAPLFFPEKTPSRTTKSE